MTLSQVLADFGRLALLLIRSPRTMAAENLFLRKQLAMFQEHQVKPHRANDATRWVMAALSLWFEWRDALVVVRPDRLIRWHRQEFRLFCRRKSRPVGGPRLPQELQQLIRTMAAENITWGEERIANELKVKFGIRVAPSTVRKYMNRSSRPAQDPAQCWSAFLRNHAQVIVASDFFTAVTYVFIVMELGRRVILHCGVTGHPTAEWTLQQFREALPGSHPYRFVIHGRDRIFSRGARRGVGGSASEGCPHSGAGAQANSRCEQLVGTVRRERLDFLIPLGEAHLRRVLKTWVAHYNQGRDHMSLGPGIPASRRPPPEETSERHRIPDGRIVRRRAVLGGLHHEYWLEKRAA